MSRKDSHTTGAKATRREAAIMDAAQSLFAERGYEQTTIQDVADAAGLLKGSLYYYVGSKEELLFRVMLRTHQELHEHVTSAVDPDGPVALSTVHTFVERHVEWVLAHRSASSLWPRDQDVIRSVETWGEALLAARRRHEQVLLTIIRRLQASETVEPDLDAELTTKALLSMANAARGWFAESGTATRGEVARHHADLATRSLRP